MYFCLEIHRCPSPLICSIRQHNPPDVVTGTWRGQEGDVAGRSEASGSHRRAVTAGPVEWMRSPAPAGRYSSELSCLFFFFFFFLLLLVFFVSYICLSLPSSSPVNHLFFSPSSPLRILSSLLTVRNVFFSYSLLWNLLLFSTNVSLLIPCFTRPKCLQSQGVFFSCIWTSFHLTLPPSPAGHPLPTWPRTPFPSHPVPPFLSHHHVIHFSQADWWKQPLHVK